MKAAPEKNRVRSTGGFSRKSTVAGQDSLAVILLLQKRWEDEEGNVYSKRSGMMVQRYTESTPDWVNDATYPILYGNITSKPEYKPYMRIQAEERYTLNSKRKKRSYQEVGCKEPGESTYAYGVAVHLQPRRGLYQLSGKHVLDRQRRIIYPLIWSKQR